MSHTIIPFTRSNLICIEGNNFLISQEKPHQRRLIQYNFKSHQLHDLLISPPFSKYLTSNTISLNVNQKTFDQKSPATMLHTSLWKSNPTPTYDNLTDFPLLKKFFEKPADEYHALTTYGNSENTYRLDVWYSQAYVIHKNGVVTAFHIDQSLELQDGDSGTFVWCFDEHFAVYNAGDVYSVVLIVRNP